MRLKNAFSGTIAVAAIAWISTAGTQAAVRPGHTTPIFARHTVPPAHLFVSEAYDIAGSETRIVTFPIVNGILQTSINDMFPMSVPAIETVADGLLYNNVAFNGVTIAVIDPKTHGYVRRIKFGLRNNETKAVTALAVDRADRLYMAFIESRGLESTGIAIFPRDAYGQSPPFALIQLPGRGLVVGMATYNDALYVSRLDTQHGGARVEVYAPLPRPHLVREITGLNNPMGLAFDASGELYICNSGTGTVLAIKPMQRGPVHPDRTISLPRGNLCTPNPDPFVFYAGGLAVLGTHLFVGAINSNEVVELDANRGGPQAPLARVKLPEGSNPWHAIDIAIDAN